MACSLHRAPCLAPNLVPVAYPMELCRSKRTSSYISCPPLSTAGGWCLCGRECAFLSHRCCIVLHCTALRRAAEPASWGTLVVISLASLARPSLLISQVAHSLLEFPMSLAPARRRCRGSHPFSYPDVKCCHRAASRPMVILSCHLHLFLCFC